ncbi:hypothetical protein UPYG_G00290450 [Umbra pygmaea]|uniref:Coiled-coil domain-containing protein 24 n=1 Tax=Umbra pygmaea TaxID=75934 RepID=A0ABD0WMV7_UMBPY
MTCTVTFMEEFECPLSVWNQIVEHVPRSESREIRGLLGDALIDMYNEMYSEVTVWTQIWQGVRSKHGTRLKSPCSPLADPPAVKELLKAEIQLLLSSVRQRASQEGRDGDSHLLRYSPAVVNYALAGAGYRSPSGIQVIQGQYSERPSSRSSVTSTTSQEDIDALRHQLNVTHIDNVVDRLKSALTEECAMLKRQVQFLQESVEQEQQRQCDVTEALEPTVTELKEIRHAILLDLERHCLIPSSPVETSPPTNSRSTGLPTDDIQRIFRPHPPHPRPSAPLAGASVRTPPLNRTRGQPSSLSNTREHCPLQTVTHEYPCTINHSSVTSHSCNDRANACEDSHLPTLVCSPSTVNTAELCPKPVLEHSIRDRSGRCSPRLVTERLQTCDDSGSDSVTSRISVSSGGRRSFSSCLQPLWSEGSCDQQTPASMFHPAPPAAQRPASRGQRVSRRLPRGQPTQLLSPISSGRSGQEV